MQPLDEHQAELCEWRRSSAWSWVCASCIVGLGLLVGWWLVAWVIAHLPGSVSMPDMSPVVVSPAPEAHDTSAIVRWAGGLGLLSFLFGGAGYLLARMGMLPPVFDAAVRLFVAALVLGGL
jgi:hypothetical protein